MLMANPEHLAMLKKCAVDDKGIKTWNRWIEENQTVRPDLSSAVLRDAYLFMSDLRGADLSGIYLSGANLGAANLSGACINNANLLNADLAKANLSGMDSNRTNFGGARLSGTNLSNANLVQADLNAANFRWANLRGANLCGANLCNAILSEAVLDRTDLTETKAGFTTFVNVDLSGAKGLETLRHHFPSSIGIDTIYRSKGKIPHIFLRGCGVPDNFIEYMASLVGTGIEFYSLFISYSTKDQEFADRLHADLQAKGVRCWFAPHDMRSGKKLHEQIDEAIRVHDKLLLILSPASMESEWVMTEISKARKREVREGKRVLFPISLCSFHALRDWECFDADTGKDSAREIREYFIPDFSNWKNHDAYRLAFERLLDDLHGKPKSD